MQTRGCNSANEFCKTLKPGMIPDPIEAVIFDMDGLLLDTEPLYREATFVACADQGYVMIDHVYLSLIGAPRELEDTKLTAYFGDKFDLNLYHTACRGYISEQCKFAVPLRPGARQILAHLRGERIPCGVATSTPREIAVPWLEIAGIGHFIDALVTRTDVTRGKPHPETFLKTASALNARPSHCLALEDSYNGVRAAAAAGMATIMVPDLLAPTAEITALCVGVLASLDEVQQQLQARGDQRG